MLNWRPVTPSNNPKHWVKGSEIDSCVPDGFLSRFRIASIRCYVWQADASNPRGGTYVADAFYRVYDAETISDAQVREGVKPASVGNFDTLDAALASIEPYRFHDFESECET